MSGSVSGKQWHKMPLSEGHVTDLMNELSISRFVATCVSHHFPEPTEYSIKEWAQPTFDHLHDPFLMKGMGDALTRIEKALHDGERIRIVTDYDVDGTTSSLILQSVCKMLSGRDVIDYHIPNRFVEGYGFSRIAAEQAAKDGIDLIITADIGIRDTASVSRARQLGVDVVICDHHLPQGGEGPEDANVILCPPQFGCDYPNPDLAACGVSLKLAQAMLSRSRAHKNRPDFCNRVLKSFMKLAAIGTIADVVSLSAIENRAIVQIGLDALRHGTHTAGLDALLKVSGVQDGWVDAGTIGYNVAPRINAAGRIEDAKLVVDLLLCRDPVVSRGIAAKIDDLNTTRKGLQERLVQEAIASVPHPLPEFITVHGSVSEGWHSGVVGIVAGRLRDHFNRPVAVISVAGNTARGSVRSTPDVHAVEALTSAEEVLNRFGGHAAAAGFDVDTPNIEKLSLLLNGHVSEAMKGGSRVPQLLISAVANPEEIDLKSVVNLERLGPFGKDNPTPLVQISGVRPAQIRQLKGQHLKFSVNGLPCIWFRSSEYWDEVENKSIDIVGEMSINRYKQRSSPQLIVRDVRISET